MNHVYIEAVTSSALFPPFVRWDMSFTLICTAFLCCYIYIVHVFIWFCLRFSSSSGFFFLFFLFFLFFVKHNKCVNRKIFTISVWFAHLFSRWFLVRFVCVYVCVLISNSRNTILRTVTIYFLFQLKWILKMRRTNLAKQKSVSKQWEKISSKNKTSTIFVCQLIENNGKKNSSKTNAPQNKTKKFRIINYGSMLYDSSVLSLKIHKTSDANHKFDNFMLVMLSCSLVRSFASIPAALACAIATAAVVALS